MFTEQVRKTGFVSKTLLPSIFAHTNVSDRSRGLDLSGWQVEEFVVSGELSTALFKPTVLYFRSDIFLNPDLDSLDNDGLSRLAAHAYYRALRTVPSLVRSDWESVKNKQLSMSIEAFTSRAFSPLLVEHELARVHAEEAKGTLQDDEMSIKVLSNVNEVKATVSAASVCPFNGILIIRNLVQYTVDEQPMEIAVRIPPNFPLSPVEVKDVKRIGVPEATWRAWLLNVQLIISQQVRHVVSATER